MADISIHQLPDASALTGAESVPIDDGVATRKATVGALRAGLAAAAHAHAVADVGGLQSALDAKAPLASPVFTGTPVVNGNPVAAKDASGNLSLTGKRFEVSGIADTNNQGFRVQANGQTVAYNVSATGGAFVIQRWNGTAWTQVFALDASALYAGSTAMVATGSGHLRLRSYTVATLPSVAALGELIAVSDGAGNRRLAVSDGAVWRFPDGTLAA